MIRRATALGATAGFLASRDAPPYTHGGMRPALILLAVSLAIAGAGCGGSSVEPHASGGEVTNLKSVDQVRSAFAADAGRPRLVLLLSPT